MSSNAQRNASVRDQEKRKTLAPTAIIQAQARTSDDFEQNLRRLAPASVMSIVFHCVLLGLFALLAPHGSQAVEIEVKDDGVLATETPDDGDRLRLNTSDLNEASRERDIDLNYDVRRRAEVSVPGSVDPEKEVGIRNAPNDVPPTNLPPPGGFGEPGQGGALEGPIGNSTAANGPPGGYGNLPPLPGPFAGRSGATREKLVGLEGGSPASEVAVNLGLAWLARHQDAEGYWKLDGRFPDKGNANDPAGAALGLLPFLGAGKTHKLKKNNPYDMVVDKALRYLVNIQDKKNGSFAPRDMYAHGLCTIAMCEAFGLSQDYNLKNSAQKALNFIVSAQHSAGGWRYSPGMAGDTSVTGWQIMALKSGLMCGLDVPAASLRKAQNYLENEVLHAQTEGYGYLDGNNATKSMTAVALLCRQYLQGWGSQNLRMIKGVDTYIKPNFPKAEVKDVYYYYYATQVMHHFGGDDWKNWNAKNRDLLVTSQNKEQAKPELCGSWTPKNDQWGQTGGRLMVTSLNILSLEVYYRYLPLYYRDTAAKN